MTASPENSAGPESASNDDLSASCMELLAAIRGLVQDVTGKTATLASELGERNGDLGDSVGHLQKAVSHGDILHILGLIVAQTESIQSTVEATRRDLEEARQAMEAKQQELAEARKLLIEDPLTGTINRRGLDAALSREIARAQRSQTALTLAMVDLDYFKQINDKYGHDVGDRMLVHFVALTKSSLRKSDSMIRYGGEEFTLVLPDTDIRGAQFVFGRLQMLVAKTPLPHQDAAINTTFSVGIAQFRAGDDGEALLQRADQALYAAKQAGRNCIRVIP